VIEPSRVVAVVLAAGASRRFGDADKLSADYRGQPLINWAARAATSLPFRAVLGVVREEGPVATLLRQSGIEVCANAAPERGMGSSIAVGVAAAGAFDPEACLILLGDMPLVTTSHLEAILAAFQGDGDAVVSVSHGRHSPPSLFGRRHFAALLALDGDEGARALARCAKTVEAAGGVLGDIDRPEDVA
jgi:molybdenum cofactor cytidylyltransferase